jgi:hypothetical protein
VKIQEEKQYITIEDADAIIARLKESYPGILMAVNPEEIVVLGISNKERPPFYNKNAVINLLRPAMRALLQRHKDQVKYFIEVYCSDWITWNEPRRQWILLHELLHVPMDFERGLVHHDCEDFAMILDAIGVDWWNREDLPSLLDKKAFQFNDGLSARLHKAQEEGEEQ